MVRKPFASSIWLGQLGLLFHTTRMIAAYIPSRKVVVYPESLVIRKVRHVARWRQELHTDMFPDPDFYPNILAEIAAMTSELDRTHYPTRGR